MVLSQQHEQELYHPYLKQLVLPFSGNRAKSTHLYPCDRGTVHIRHAFMWVYYHTVNPDFIVYQPLHSITWLPGFFLLCLKVWCQFVAKWHLHIFRSERKIPFNTTKWNSSLQGQRKSTLFNRDGGLNPGSFCSLMFAPLYLHRSFRQCRCELPS